MYWLPGVTAITARALPGGKVIGDMGGLENVGQEDLETVEARSDLETVQDSRSPVKWVGEQLPRGAGQAARQEPG